MQFRHLALTAPLLAALAGCPSSSIERMPLQPPGCDTIVVDTQGGTINGLRPTASQAEVMAQFPCATGDTEDGSAFNCGGGVFFLNHTFFAYTGRDYWEIRQGFSGEIDVPILGAVRSGVDIVHGDPVRTHDDGDRAFYFYKKAWGTLVVEVREGVVTKFSMHDGKAPADVELCL
jgi:hypothetical protein